MAVEIKTIDELYDDILNDYATQLGVDVTDLGKSYQVRAKVAAGIQYTLYTTLAIVQKNMFPDLAEEEELIRQGNQILGRSPSPATQGQYTVQVTGSIGATIPASTQFKADDSTNAAGFLFIVDNDFVLSATTDTLTIRALTPGLGPLLAVGDTLTSTQPIVNVDSQGEITAITVQPSAAEDIESYRADVLEARRLEPQGGAASDYVLWANDVPEVRRVYPYLDQANPGNITVYVEATPENSNPLGIPGEPTSTTLDDVYDPPDGATPESGALIYDSVDNRGRKPVGVFNISCLSVIPVPVDLYFTGLTDESISGQLRSFIDALLFDIRPFIAGADRLTDKNDILTIALIISQTVNLLAGTGETYTNLTMQVSGIEESSHQFIGGYYPYLRNIYNNGGVI